MYQSPRSMARPITGPPSPLPPTPAAESIKAGQFEFYSDDWSEVSDGQSEETITHHFPAATHQPTKQCYQPTHPPTQPIILPEAKAFITRLLKLDPAERPTAAEALEDPWITSKVDALPLGTKFGPRLNNFTSMNALKKVKAC